MEEGSVTLNQALTKLWATGETVAERSAISEEVAKAVGCNATTASNWLRGKRLPKGERLVKLLVYLADVRDYKVKEFEKLDPTVQRLNRFVAYGTKSIAEITGETGLGYQNEQDTYRLLSGRSQLTDERRQKVIALIGEDSSSDPNAMWPMGRSRPRPPADAIRNAVQTSLGSPSPAKTTEVADATLLTAAGHVMQLLPLLEQLADAPTAVHEQLRAIVGADRFLRVSTLANALTSPRVMSKFHESHPQQARRSGA